MKPKVFIGSSSERIEITTAIQMNLETAADVFAWDQGIFSLSESGLDSLLKALKDFDFAIFLLVPDDISYIRDEAKSVVRDNVIFELGLFIGHLGKERTFMIVPAQTKLHLPTDLAGITYATYIPRDDDNYQMALNTACAKIRKNIKEVGIVQDRQEFTCKDNIDKTWSSLIQQATKSVKIFAGDVSWVTRDSSLIQDKIQEGVDFFVLCEKPKKKGLIRTNVLKLIELGVNVKYYSEGHETSLRGLIVDGEDPQLGIVLIIEKVREKNIRETEGKPGNPNYYKYKATYYYPDSNLHITEALFQYFNSLFKFSSESILFENWNLSKKDILKILKHVDLYSDLEEDDIEVKNLQLSEIWASCKYVKLEKLNKLSSFVLDGESQGISPFSPCLCINYEGKKTILPPILEKHGSKYVVIDGMHRLYNHFMLNKKDRAICLVVKRRVKLPSEPVRFDSVNITSKKYPRESSFINYDEKFFRDIKKLDEILSVDLSKR